MQAVCAWNSSRVQEVSFILLEFDEPETTEQQYVQSNSPSEGFWEPHTCYMQPTASSFPIYVCVEIDEPSASIVEVPEITLRLKSLKLIPVTFFRAVKVHGWASDRPEHERDERCASSFNSDAD